MPGRSDGNPISSVRATTAETQASSPAHNANPSFPFCPAWRELYLVASAVSLCCQRPVKWCSLFVVGKQICQTIAAKKMNTMVIPYRHFYSCNALRILRSSSCLWVLRFTSQFVILLAAPPHSSRQLLCPSQPFTQPLLHYVSFHLVRFNFTASVPCILI